MSLDNIGVVIIGRNEGQRLVSCLDSMHVDPNRIVYVDSGSTDDSVAMTARRRIRVVKLDLSRPFTAARARNEGFTALKATNPDLAFVQFVDGDCELAFGWLERAAEFLARRADVAIVCGRRRERHPERSVYNRLCDVEWNTPIGKTRACGGDFLARFAAFEGVGGFRSETIAGEEPELCIRLRSAGWKIWRIDAEMTRHDAAIARFGQWWLRSVRTGHAFAEIWWLHRRSPYGLYRREVLRTAIWGAVLPAGILLGAIYNPFAVLAVAIYPLQICRIAVHRGGTRSLSWAYALSVTMGKFAESQGAAKYLWRRWRGKGIRLIEYKHAA